MMWLEDYRFSQSQPLWKENEPPEGGSETGEPASSPNQKLPLGRAARLGIGQCRESGGDQLPTSRTLPAGYNRPDLLL